MFPSLSLLIDSSEKDQHISVLTRDTYEQRAKEFLSRNPPSDSEIERKVVVVMQQELARVDTRQESNVILASDDATTCVLAVAHCEVSGLACIVHFDESTVTAETINQWILGMRSPSIYLVGDYVQSSSSNSTVSSMLLWSMQRLKDITIKLELLCIRELNTKDDGFPATYALSYDVSTKMLYPSIINNAGIVGELERKAALWSQYECSLTEVYTQQCIRLRACHIEKPYHMASLLNASDSDLLLFCSTSPLHEKPSFPQDLRRVLLWILSLKDNKLDFSEQIFDWAVETGWVKRLT